MNKLNAGFYTAMGTPLDVNGDVIESSLRRQIDMQIEAGASGLLLLGSMGIQAAVKTSAWAEAARIAADHVNGRVALFVGAMDCSVWRAKERLDMIKGLKIDGVVMTAPYYSPVNPTGLFKFFSDVADATEHPLYLYDLPSVTQTKITFPLVEKLILAGKIKGIKSPDPVLARQLHNKYPECNFLFSNIDCFDVALSYKGIDKVLDGMFACTPKNAKLFVEAYKAGDIETAGKYLDKILWFRDQLLAGHPGAALLHVFTVAMNLLGMEGIYSPDYFYTPELDITEKVREQLVEIGEL